MHASHRQSKHITRLYTFLRQVLLKALIKPTRSVSRLAPISSKNRKPLQQNPPSEFFLRKSYKCHRPPQSFTQLLNITFNLNATMDSTEAEIFKSCTSGSVEEGRAGFNILLSTVAVQAAKMDRRRCWLTGGIFATLVLHLIILSSFCMHEETQTLIEL